MSADNKHKNGSFVHLGAGALSGVTSCILLQPFDLLKTRLQQQQQQQNTTGTSRISVIKTIQSVVRADGVRGLWRGTAPTLIRNAPGTSLYFYFLNHTKQICLRTEQKIWHDPTRNTLSPTSNMLMGASSRALAGFLLMPGTVLKVQYESSLYKYKGIAPAVLEIWQKGGVRGFFVGAVPTVIRDAPYAGLYMLLYESAKAQQRKYFQLPDATVTMVAGVTAGLTASYMTQPFDLVKTRMQLRPTEYTSIVQAFGKILRQESVTGFFRGISMRVLRKGIQASLVFTLYEWILRTNSNATVQTTLKA